MGIIRVQKNANYVVMNRTALNDKRLSWKAKGIMAYMLSMPDDWVFYMEELQSHSTDGKASFQSGFKELKDCGYVERRPIREGQRIKAWETIVHEVPNNSLQTDFQEVENQEVGFQEVENQPLLNTDINQVLNKPNIEDDDDTLRFFQSNIRYNLNPLEVETILHWENEYPKELIIEAIKRTALANASTVKYTERILMAWEKQKITTLAEVQRADAARENRGGKRASNTNSRPTKVYDDGINF